MEECGPDQEYHNFFGFLLFPVSCFLVTLWFFEERCVAKAKGFQGPGASRGGRPIFQNSKLTHFFEFSAFIGVNLRPILGRFCAHL
jgi:hypothetical protein